MKIKLQSKQLLERLQLVAGALSAKTTIAILENFLFEVEDNKMMITATDLETTITGVLEVTSDEQGSVAVPARLLLEILKAFPDQPLEFIFEKGESNMIIKSDNGEYSLGYYDGKEYPKQPHFTDGDQVVIDSEVLAKAISKTIFATGTDDLRPIMTGILIQISESGVVFVATDAHRLVKYSRADVKSHYQKEAVLPKKAMAIVKSIVLGSKTPVTISFTDVNASFTINEYTVSCRLVDGKYPNHEAVIPKGNDKVMIADRIQLIKVLKCVSIFSNRTTHEVALNIKGNDLQILAEDIDYSNKADERMTCNYDGKDIKIGFNGKFLLDSLGNMDSEEIRLEMSAVNRAGILYQNDGLEEDEQLLMLVMPVMLK